MLREGWTAMEVLGRFYAERINHNTSLIKRAVLLAAATRSTPTPDETQPPSRPSVNFEVTCSPPVCVCAPAYSAVYYVPHTRRPQLTPTPARRLDSSFTVQIDLGEFQGIQRRVTELESRPNFVNRVELRVPLLSGKVRNMCRA